MGFEKNETATDKSNDDITLGSSSSIEPADLTFKNLYSIHQSQGEFFHFYFIYLFIFGIFF